MLKLLIADDEKYDRDSIADMISAEFNQTIEISKARNGREAIEIAERVRPDIIITDIKMPGINGLKATEEINKFLPNVYFIILTAYDYFDFAVEAVKNNVKQYILKPFNTNEVIARINDAVKFVMDEKKKRKDEIENQEKIYNLIPILENELSYSIVNNTLHLIDYETYMKYLDLSFKYGYSIVAELKNPIKDENFKLKIGEHIKEFINRGHKAIGSYLFTEKFVYFIQLKSLEEENKMKKDAYYLAENINHEVNNCFGIALNIGIGSFQNCIEQLYKSYEEGINSLDHIPPGTSITYYGDILNEIKVQHANKEKIALFKAVEQYIIENIHEEIDLEKTAVKFNLSTYYFCRTFKEVLDYNFSDYVNVVRINKAKELLRDDFRSIKEVGYLVGYNDPNYFSKVFKKYAGISPSEYKAK